MKRNYAEHECRGCVPSRNRWPALIGSITLICLQTLPLDGQTAAQDSVALQVQQLTAAMARAEAQLEDSQHQLAEMRQQLATLQQRMATSTDENPQYEPNAAAKLAAQVEELREQQGLQGSQIATQEQAKVESESKYPVKVSGLILLNGFVNTQQVDVPATPTVAIGGAGSTGLSLLQTVLGLDARGPHLFGARSFADVRVDFDGRSSSGTITPGAYNNSIGLLRLRTAHASMEWKQTQAFFSLDRPIISPNTPSSLTAVAVPALAWSGNLWSWNPQVGVTHDLTLSAAERLRMQAALIDVSDAPTVAGVVPAAAAAATTSAVTPPSTAEQSRWPGVESRFALLGTQQENGAQLGIGGFFAPHRIFNGTRFDAWAGTIDYRLPLPARLELSGSAYRGQSLGGLGGGGFKDYAYYFDGTDTYFRALDDMGGWAQLKERASERLEFNAAFGMDNVPAGQLRPYAGSYSATYQNLARTRTFTGNFIYSPSAYLLFSLEYRRLESSPVNSPTAGSNVIGVGAGYKF
jgi:hypothetical protein